MTLSEWKKSKGYTLAQIAKQLGFPANWGESLVSRHANFDTVPTLETAQKYIDISGGAITLADLIKPKRRKRRAA